MTGDTLRMNLLLVASMGVGIALMALVLLAFKAQLGGGARFILPVPPLAVAAYVYVVTFAKELPGDGGITTGQALVDGGIASIAAAIVFFIFSTISVLVPTKI